jgi:hypothetical protein
MSDEEFEVKDHQLLEHPNETTRRLKALGEWKEADRVLRKVKQNLHRQYQSEGGPLTLGRRVALAKAGWDAVHEQWPPSAGAVPLDSVIEYVQTFQGSRGARNLELPPLSFAAAQRFSEIGETESLTDETIWVYHNIENDAVSPFDCPSRGAWSLLAYAREDKNRFYRLHFKTATAEVARRTRAVESGLEPSKQEKYCRDELRKMLEAAREEALQGAG